MAEHIPREMRQRPSAHGAALGAALAGLIDKAAEREPQLDTRCSTCAFRAGTIPNQMAGTLLDAMRIVVGVDPAVFMCHHEPGVVSGRNQPTTICAGYLLAHHVTRDELLAALGDVSTELDAMAQANPGPATATPDKPEAKEGT